MIFRRDRAALAGRVRGAGFGRCKGIAIALVVIFVSSLAAAGSRFGPGDVRGAAGAEGDRAVRAGIAAHGCGRYR